MATEAAELFVTVSGDVDKGVRALNTVNDHVGKTDGFLRGATKSAAGFLGGMVAFNVGAKAMSLVTDGAIGMNAELETSTLQFTTLMGNADKARKHVESLFDFAAKTPFETGPIIEASRLMETFGGSALNTKDNLENFGDAAAATGQPINEVAFWMSRAYAAIQAGKPWGEAAQRLGEMGVVTPQVRAKLEALQDSGASGAKVWEGLTGSLGKFDGAMEKQAETFDGMLSTFMDGVNMFLAKALKPLFNGLKVLLKGANALMASPAFNGALEAIGAGIGAAFSVVGEVFSTLFDIIGPLIQAFGYIFDVIQSGEDVASGLHETIGNLGEVFADIGSKVLQGLTMALEAILEQIPAWTDAFFDLAGTAINTIIDMAPGFIDAVLNFLQGALDWVLTTGVPLAAEAIAHFAEKFIEWVGPAAEKLAAALPGIAEKILTFIATNLPVIGGKLLEWAGAFIGWVAKNVLPKLPGALWAIATTMFTWLDGVAGTLLAKAGDMGRGFVENVIQFLGRLPLSVAGVLSQVISTVLGWGGNMAKAFGSIAVTAGKSFANGIVGLLEGAINAVIRGLNSLQIHFDGMDLGPLGRVAAIHWNGFGLGMVRLPRFLEGTMDTGARSGLAMLDPHEAVLPKRAADRWRDGDGGGSTVIVHVYIDSFVGTQENADYLSRTVGEQVRLTTPRRTATSGAN
jgi:hypothetical protein